MLNLSILSNVIALKEVTLGCGIFSISGDIKSLAFGRKMLNGNP